MMRLTRIDAALTFAAGIAAFALYLRTLAPTVLGFDSGEFQFVVPTLGLAHPTGYPLYLLLGKLFTALPVGDVAYRVNLFSAVAMAVTQSSARSLSGAPSGTGGASASASRTQRNAAAELQVH